MKWRMQFPPTIMPDSAGRLQAFTQSVLADGYTHVLLIGMGGSSLAPELFYKTFGKQTKPPLVPHPFLDLAGPAN